jgi:hypothetical protein
MRTTCQHNSQPLGSIYVLTFDNSALRDAARSESRRHWSPALQDAVLRMHTRTVAVWHSASSPVAKLNPVKCAVEETRPSSLSTPTGTAVCPVYMRTDRRRPPSIKANAPKKQNSGTQAKPPQVRRENDAPRLLGGLFVTSDGAKVSTVDTARELHGAESTYRDYYQDLADKHALRHRELPSCLPPRLSLSLSLFRACYKPFLLNLTNYVELSTTREAKRPPVVRPLDSFPAFYITQSFITAFTRALHLSLS